MASYILLELKTNYKLNSTLIFKASLTTFGKGSCLISTSNSV